MAISASDIGKRYTNQRASEKSHDEPEIEVKHGEVTGRELFRVRGVDMAWMPTREMAIDVAGRVQKAIAANFFAAR